MNRAVQPSQTLTTDETDRLTMLGELLILDSGNEPAFDSIARMASEICGTPIALITLVDKERQWFKANVGLPGFYETPRDIAFCAHAIEDDDILQVSDARLDPRFANNPMVTGAPDIRFYAGAPLILPGGERMGTLCVIDHLARQLDQKQATLLRSLAVIVSQLLVMRRDLVNRALSAAAQQRQTLAQSERFMRQITDNLPVGIAYVDTSLRYRFVNQAHCARYGLTRYQILGRTRSELKEISTDPLVDAGVSAVLKGQTQHFEFDDACSNGLRRIESTLTPDILTNGEVAGFFATCIDITERTANERALRELTAIVENTSDFVTQIDRYGVVTYMNPAARRASAIALDQPLGQLRFEIFNPPASMLLHSTVILPALREQGIWVGENTVYGRNRQEIPVSHMVIAHRDSLGRIERYSTVMRDITLETSAKRDADIQTNILRSVTEAIPEIVSVLGADLRYRFVNGSFERWMSMPGAGIVDQLMSAVLGEETFARYLPWLERCLAGESVVFESAFATSSGVTNLVITMTPVLAVDKRVDSVVVVARDVTLQTREQARLRELSERDPLSGLLNRVGLDQYVQCELVADRGGSLALLYLDLDHFKAVNDQLGHAAGDQVLLRFSQRLRNVVRPTDGVARIGGDEFAIVMAGLPNQEVALTVAQEILVVASEPFQIPGHRISLSVSIGVAFGVKGADGWTQLLARADANLYAAKSAGRGCVVAAPDV